MNQNKVKASAEALNTLLQKYGIINQDAKSLQDAMSMLISDALSGKIVDPLDSRCIPGRFFFDEGGLRKYSDLEAAFVRFKTEVTGGENSVISRVARQMEARERAALQAKSTGTGKASSD